MQDLCSTGKQQSPVAIANVPKSNKKSAKHPEISYPAGTLSLKHKETTPEIKLTNENTLTYNGMTYTLEDIRFSAPAEHTLDNKTFPLEVIFTHRAADGKLAILSSFVEEGAFNPAIEQILANTPGETGTVRTYQALSFQADSLLPPLKNQHFYSYMGSTSQAPCTENVERLVLSQPITASKRQIEAYKAAFPATPRDVQPLNERVVQYLH